MLRGLAVALVAVEDEEEAAGAAEEDSAEDEAVEDLAGDEAVAAVASKDEEAAEADSEAAEEAVEEVNGGEPPNLPAPPITFTFNFLLRFDARPAQ